MRQAIYFKRGDDAPVETYFTTLFVITEWERIENRRLGDGRGFGATEIAWCLWFILKLKGEDVGDDARAWREMLHHQHPDWIITEGRDMTDPNPTGGDHSEENSPNS